MALMKKAVYKPYVLKVQNGWMMWYNGAKYIPDKRKSGDRTDWRKHSWTGKNFGLNKRNHIQQAE